MGKQIVVTLLMLTLSIITNSKLLFVFEHCRHGARTPSSGVDKDNIDSMKQKWDFKGELTGVGMRMHYLLGYINYKKYNGFLSDHFEPKELLVMSTDINRTIQSVLSQVQGMYPLSNGPTLNDKQLKNAYPPNDLSDDAYKPIINELKNFALPNQMQLIPIQVFEPRDRIYILYEPYKTSKCKAINTIRSENRKKENVIQKKRDFNSTYGEKLLKFYNQMDPDYIFNSDLVAFCDHFLVNLYEDRDLSKIKDLGIVLNQLHASCEKILDELFYEIVFGDKERNVALLSISSSMSQILHFIQRRVDLDQKGQSDLVDYSAPKMLIHSGHDSSMSGMQVFMQKAFGTKTVNPVFADNMFFELQKKENQLKGDLTDYSIDYYIRDKLIKTIPYDEFDKTIRGLIWDDSKIESFCNMGESNNHKSILWIVIWVLASISVILIIVIIALYCLMRKNNQETLMDPSSINNQ